MAEYINKQAFLDHMKGTSRYFNVKFDIENFPVADVAPVVHGRWMHETTEDGFHSWKCSRCGRGMNDNPGGVELYCYHCGAKMDGDGSGK